MFLNSKLEFDFKIELFECYVCLTVWVHILYRHNIRSISYKRQVVWFVDEIISKIDFFLGSQTPV